MNILIGGIIFANAFAGTFQSTTICRPADSLSASVIAHLQAVVTGSDSGNAKLRQAYNLPLVATTPPVVLVTDELACADAKAAVEARYTDGTTSDQVYVFRVGTTRMVAFDGRAGGRGGIMMHVFDSAYTYLVTIE